jgi:hypothetical protein
MKINNKIFSLPPYLSTSWVNITALHLNGSTLVVHLVEGEIINIPNLKSELIEMIFEAHASFLEEKNKQDSGGRKGYSFQEMEFPFKFGIGATDGLGTVLQHNPTQANLPPLPSDVLEKIKSIAKIIAPEDITLIPKPEPHCNCMHCQIARTINQGLGLADLYNKDEKSAEELVKDDELKFQQWEIKPMNDNDKLYIVTNRLDPHESYNVYLGHPLGCTCGKEGCEHIVAVLKS